MSVTAASGFVASGVHAGIRRSGPDLAIVRSTSTRGRCRGVDDESRARGARARVEGASRSAEPQAVVINAGVANAATGAAGVADAERTAAEVASAAGSGARGGRRALDRRHRRPAADGSRRSRASTRACSALAADGGAERRGRDPHDRPLAEAGRGCRRRLRRRRDGEGRGDDPSAARDDARGDHDRLPARRRASRSPSSAMPSTRASTGSRSTASARRTTPSCCSPTGRAVSSAFGNARRGVRCGTAARCAPRSRGRSSPTARARP